MSKINQPYEEALRYYQNAIDILKTKAKKNGRYYQDIKYVQMACNTAYSGILIALNEYLLRKDKPIIKGKYQRKNVDDYRQALAKLDYNLLNEFNTAYNILHLSCHYDCENSIKVIDAGIDSARVIIEKIG